MIEEIIHNQQLIALIIRSTYNKSGISFFTAHELSQQVSFMKHEKGHQIKAHVHNEVQRTVVHTKETLFIRNGILRVDLYSDERIYLESKMLYAGDVILLVSGGHGFKVIQDLEMIEVKQGPYAGLYDKTVFEPVQEHNVVVKENNDPTEFSSKEKQLNTDCSC